LAADTIWIAAILGLLAPLGSGCCQTWEQPFAYRILLGIGMGFKEVTVPIFSAEISLANVRGALFCHGNYGRLLEFFSVPMLI
jgi:hypothetical protein